MVATGFTVVNPNDAQIVQFFGRYVGSIRVAGFHLLVVLCGDRAAQPVVNTGSLYS